MFDMKGFNISASGVIQGHHGPLVFFTPNFTFQEVQKLQWTHCYFFYPTLTNSIGNLDLKYIQFFPVLHLQELMVKAVKIAIISFNPFPHNDAF